MLGHINRLDHGKEGSGFVKEDSKEGRENLENCGFDKLMIVKENCWRNKEPESLDELGQQLKNTKEPPTPCKNRKTF